MNGASEIKDLGDQLILVEDYAFKLYLLYGRSTISDSFGDKGFGCFS